MGPSTNVAKPGKSFIWSSCSYTAFLVLGRDAAPTSRLVMSRYIVVIHRKTQAVEYDSLTATIIDDGMGFIWVEVSVQQQHFSDSQ